MSQMPGAGWAEGHVPVARLAVVVVPGVLVVPIVAKRAARAITASDAVDLGALLFNPPEPWRSDPELRIRALARSGSLIKRMASAGVKHPDLNARNLLLHRTDDGVQPVLIDLDRCAVSERPAAAPSLLRRLERSARKIGHTVGGYWPAESWSILVRAATGGEEP